MPAAKKPRKPSKKRIAKALEAFLPTLDAFCEAMLANGKRSGREWICAHLENSQPKRDGSGSCSINLDSGCFYDHNPSATPQKGGPVDLFSAVCGLCILDDVIPAMEAWCKDGSLPGGRKGDPKPREIEIEPEEVITARDDKEAKLLREIKRVQHITRVWERNQKLLEYLHVEPDKVPEDVDVDYARGIVETRDGVRASRAPLYTHFQGGLYPDKPWTTEYSNPDEFLYMERDQLLEGIEVDYTRGIVSIGQAKFYFGRSNFGVGGTTIYYADHPDEPWTRPTPKPPKYYPSSLELAKSAFWRYRWQQACKEAKDYVDLPLRLAGMRGLSPDVFDWLIEHNYLAIYHRECKSRTGSEFESHDLAFPVTRPFTEAWGDGSVTHHTLYLGMHSKWIESLDDDTMELGSHWIYYPKGIPSEPLIIGDLENADVVLLAESTWDIVAGIDLVQGWRPEETNWAAIATRGAGNSKKLKPEMFKPTAVFAGLVQNDEANKVWLKNIDDSIYKRLRIWQPPTEYKDLNDWMRAVPADDVRNVLNITL